MVTLIIFTNLTDTNSNQPGEEDAEDNCHSAQTAVVRLPPPPPHIIIIRMSHGIAAMTAVSSAVATNAEFSPSGLENSILLSSDKARPGARETDSYSPYHEDFPLPASQEETSHHGQRVSIFFSSFIACRNKCT